MDISFLSQADAVMLEMEKTKRNLESAKTAYENAKRSYDEFLTTLDDAGIPKAKLKKLIEDRTLMLFESGILDFLEPKDDSAAAKKPRKAKRVQPQADEDTANPEVLDEAKSAEADAT